MFEIIVLFVILLFCIYIFINILSSLDTVIRTQRRTFATLIFWIILWIVSIILTEVFYKNLEYSLWFSRASFPTSALITYFYYLFVKSYSIKRNIFEDIFWGIITLIFIILSLTENVVKNVYLVDDQLKSTGGSMYEVFAIYTGLLFVYSAFIFYKSYKSATNQVQKVQMLYILTGSTISIVLTFVTNLLLPILGFREVRALGPIGLTFFIIATYYVIIRYRFLSTKFVLSKVIYSLIFAFFPFGTFHVILYLQRNLWGNVYETEALITGYIYALIFIYFLPYLQKKMEVLIKYIFYKNQVDFKKAREVLVEKYNKLLNVSTVLEETKKVFESVFDTEVGVLVVKEGQIIEEFSIIDIDLAKGKLQHFLQINKILIKDELAYLETIPPGILNLYRDSDIQCVIPLEIQRNLKWKVYLTFNGKSNNTSYTIQDIDYIYSITSLMKFAVQRSYLHSKLQNFNEKLIKEVDEATSGLKSKNADLKLLRDRERDMMDIMGHELRTPLTIIKMTLGLLKTKAIKLDAKFDKKDFDEYHTRMKDAVEREIRLLETMLSSTKLDANRMEIHLEKVDLLPMIKDSIMAQKNIIEEKGLSMEFQDPKKPIEVFGDRIRLPEVVDNLLSNAVKYTKKGFIRLNIENDDIYTNIKIQDSGPGIPKDAIPHLGTKFFRVQNHIEKSSSGVDVGIDIVRPGGTGLGLYVTFGLIKMMQGKIKVESEVGVGSTFLVQIPKYINQQENEVKKNSNDAFARLGLKGEI